MLRALKDLSGVETTALAHVPRASRARRLRAYDTQTSFYYETCAYPLPDLLKASGWIDVELSQFRKERTLGSRLAKGVTNQNLERLTFADASLDIVVTSDVMEHVRLDDLAHREIYRVLKPGGIYIFTVPHLMSRDETLVRVQVVEPDDPARDVHVLEPEYHGDVASVDNKALSYRVYGRNLQSELAALGFDVEYSKTDIAENGIMNTELFYCRKRVSP
jgi:SAM-dependent methyltransferase